MNYQLCIPPYFTNIMRSFSTIEGIALKVDPSYSMVQECMPYLSRRLLTDNNPKMRAALRLMLYGKGQRLDIERLQKLTSTFGNFSTGVTSTQSASSPVFSNEERIKGSAPSFNSSLDSPVLSDTMREALKVVFAKDGSYAQELIVDELVAAVDAMSRQGLSEALKLVLGSATAVSALRNVEALGPLRTMLMPIPLPMDMLHSMEPAVQLSKEDRQALNTLSAVLDLIGGGNGSTGKSATGIISSATMRMMQGGVPNVASMASMGGKAVRAAGEVAPLLPELLPGIQVTAELFTRQLVRRMAIRLAEDLGEPKSGHQHHSHQSPTKAPSPKPKNAQDAKGWARRAPY
jgi:aarF domain-containing kinase